MKKAMILLVVVMVLFLTGCPWNSDTFFPEAITFAKVSQPYQNKYGRPEEINEYTSKDYHSIDWWWWTRGFMVSFLATTYDDVNGWTVDSTYSFSPIW